MNWKQGNQVRDFRFGRNKEILIEVVWIWKLDTNIYFKKILYKKGKSKELLSMPYPNASVPAFCKVRDDVLQFLYLEAFFWNAGMEIKGINFNVPVDQPSGNDFTMLGV